MSNPSHSWKVNPTLRFHFHQLPDGVVVYLEGEGGTYLLNPVAADLLRWAQVGVITNQTLADKLVADFPNDSHDEILSVVESTMAELRKQGFVIRDDN